MLKRHDAGNGKKGKFLKGNRSKLGFALLAGLLVAGIGTGIAFAQYSNFTYEDDMVISTDSYQKQEMQISVYDELANQLSQGSEWAGDGEPSDVTAEDVKRAVHTVSLDALGDMQPNLKVEYRDDLPAGTIQLSGSYDQQAQCFYPICRPAGYCDNPFEADALEAEVFLEWFNTGGLDTVMLFKDQVKEDLKNHVFRSYELEQPKLHSTVLASSDLRGKLTVYGEAIW